MLQLFERLAASPTLPPAPSPSSVPSPRLLLRSLPRRVLPRPAQAVDGGTAQTCGFDATVWESMTRHLTEEHCQFFRHWLHLLELEESEPRSRRGDLWAKSAVEREGSGMCLAGLQLVVSLPGAGERLGAASAPPSVLLLHGGLQRRCRGPVAQAPARSSLPCQPRAIAGRVAGRRKQRRRPVWRCVRRRTKGRSRCPAARSGTATCSSAGWTCCHAARSAARATCPPRSATLSWPQFHSACSGGR